jgi:hypothetical protein
MKGKIHKRKVDTWGELLTSALDAAASIKNNEDQFRQTVCDLNMRLAKCIVVNNGIFKHLFWTEIYLFQIWGIKTNEELDKLIKHRNIVNCIKAQRLSWFGHVQRMPDTRTVKKISKWNPLTKRSQGRPKYRWEVNSNRIFVKWR